MVFPPHHINSNIALIQYTDVHNGIYSTADVMSMLLWFSF
jgi:hypothetical protein